MNDEKYTVLIVDDIPENLQIVGNILNEQGIESYVALDGNQALKIASGIELDLILLDISMPEMDGYEVCTKLKNNPNTKDIPIIFLSARSQTEDIIKGFEYGGVDYVVKPFNQFELLQRVQTHIKLKRSQEVIERQVQELQELNTTKDKLFSIIAHDLRNPFQALMTISEFLLEGGESFTPEESKKYIRMIYDSSRHSYNLLQNLLMWAKSQTDKIPFDPEPLDIEAMLNDTATYHRIALADPKNIKIQTEITFDYKRVVADRNMIQTVFRNLVSNAIKFTQTSGTVTIGCKPFNEDETLFFVSDNGVGISQEIIKKLFKIEKGITTKGTNNEKGTGLGLILCKEFVQKNKGKIWVESEEGKGSRFYFTLPNYRK